MKKSAAATVERREEPYLDDHLKGELEAHVLPRYPTRRAALLPVLHKLQHEHGWLPYQAIEEAAEFLGITPAEACDTATFYEEFWLQPHGKYVIWVCQSISCELMGHQSLLDRLIARLGIEPGETTEDGRFTLMTVECLGSCGTAPCALVNEDLHETLDAGQLERIIDSLD